MGLFSSPFSPHSKKIFALSRSRVRGLNIGVVAKGNAGVGAFPEFFGIELGKEFTLPMLVIRS